LEYENVPIEDQERFEALEEKFKQKLYAETKYNQEFGDYIGSKVLSAKWNVWRSLTIIRKVLLATQVLGISDWMPQAHVDAIGIATQYAKDDIQEVSGELDSVYSIVSSYYFTFPADL
jgi:hypothetical protein